jgi:hypothetical protein
MSKAVVPLHPTDRYLAVIGRLYHPEINGRLHSPDKCQTRSGYPLNEPEKRHIVSMTGRVTVVQRPSKPKNPIARKAWGTPRTAPAVSYMSLYQPAAR